MHARTRFGAAILGTALAISACTVHKQDTPPLTGPSELGTSITISVSPDVLAQDGASQSIVTITARNNNGQPLANLSLRTEISVGGAVTDFGRLSARNVVTDANGRASVVYTAPAAPAVAVGSGTKIDIVVTPSGTNADNETPRVASIRLVPPGIIGPPPSPFVVTFTVPSPNLGDAAFFTANVTDPATGGDASTQIASYQWSFGDGGTASGRSVTHTFTQQGTLPVTLTTTDALGRVAVVTQSVQVGQGQVPSASFAASPSAPIVNQAVNFNASGSSAAPGHRITDFSWNFGDGTLGSGELVSHSYTQVGTYTVTLKVTDDAGRKSTVTTQTVTVGNGNPTVEFTFNPSAPRGGQQVTFDASPSQAQGGRTIVSYSWSFGDGGSGVGQTVTHTYGPVAVPTTYNVLLTITDSAGRTSSSTKPITVNP